MYSHEQWRLLLARIYHDVSQLATLKGGEYSGDFDRLANFRRNAQNLGLPMETVWGVYAAKHWDAIQQYVKDLQQDKVRERLETIDGRALDLIVYLCLFIAMLEERSPRPTHADPVEPL